ncbi:MAG: HlyD family secretion protein [Pirellulales bacterium]
MFSRNRIRIPWKQRWQRFRYSVLPMLSFVLCLAVTLIMWGRQVRLANVVGEVERRQAEVFSGRAGWLAAPTDRPTFWRPYDQVKQGDLIAIIAPIDDRPVKAAITTLNTDIERIKAEIDATRAQLEFDQSGRLDDHHREWIRMVLEKDKHELGLIQRDALIKTDEAELKRLSIRIGYLRRAGEAVARQDRDDAVAQSQVVATRIETNHEVKRKIEDLLQRNEKRLADYGPIPEGEFDTIVAPIQKSIETERAKIEELVTQLATLEVRAPMAGRVAIVHTWPGQSIQQGDPILTIAADEADSIVGYIRADQPIRPVPGMPVQIFSRMAGHKMADAKISEVGPQFETVPVELRRDPTRAEWVLPVRIPLPPELEVRPGELLDLKFRITSFRRSTTPVVPTQVMDVH